MGLVRLGLYSSWWGYWSDLYHFTPFPIKVQESINPIVIGVYPLSLIHYRKGNWLHEGSNPSTPTIVLCLSDL